MRPSSSPSIPLSSASKLPSVSFFERYERIFQCEGGACITEDKDVSMYQYHQSRSDEATDRQQNSVSSSYLRRASRKHQESSPPVVTTVMNKHQASYNDDEDTFDNDDRRIQSQTKAAQTEEAANNEYFHNRIQKLQVLIHNSSDHSQTQTQMALPILSSPDTTTQQQQQRHQQQQQCQCHSPTTPIKNSNKTYATRSPKKSKSKSTPVQFEMCTVVMPSSFRSLKERQQHERSWKQTDDSESTQSTQSMSESEGDDLSSLESHFGCPDEEDTPVGILRRKVKFGTITDIKTTDENNNRVRVRFDKDTKFPDPNEIPSPGRKHVPRMSQQQRQEYQLKHYQPTTAQRRQQFDLSSLLIQLFLQHRPL